MEIPGTCPTCFICEIPPMALKDFDFKQFLLHRGERIGLGIAVAIAALLLLWGSKGFLAGSPSTTANRIKNLSTAASQQLQNSEPPPTVEQVESELLSSLNVERIDPARYALASPLMRATIGEDTKRRNPDILAAAAALMDRPVIVGFAAETDNLEENARRKLQSKQADLIAANLVSEEGIGFNTDDNRMTLYFSSGEKEELPRAPKTAIADHLLDRVRRLVETRRGR